MASRRESKEALRAQRLAAEEAERARERRRRVVQLASAAVLGAAVIVAVLIVVSQSGGGGGGGTDIRGASDVDRLLRGVPQHGTVLGDPNAKATIVEFGDLQCPICKAFSEQGIPALIQGPVASGAVNLEFRQFTVIDQTQSVDAAKAAYAAAEQGRYWQFIELFYLNQGTERSGYVTSDFLEAVARAAGVPDIARWNADRQSARWDPVLAHTQSEARTLGFSGTPSFAIAGGKGLEPVGSGSTVPSVQQIEAAVRAAG